MNDVSKYNSLTARLLYDSPLHSRGGKIIFALIWILVLYFAVTSWIRWLTPLESGLTLMIGMTVALVGSVIGLIFLLYLDRRKPEPWPYWVAVLVVATLLTAAPAAYFNVNSPNTAITVGFNEEFWKVFPLLMLVFFAPTVVTGVRDGLIYGALGGFGFNLIEMSVYILRTTTPEQGLLEAITAQTSRLGINGIDNHVVWSALVGAGIGYAVQARNRKLGIFVAVAAYLLAVVTHDLQDSFLGIGIMMMLMMGLAPLFGADLSAGSGMSPEQQRSMSDLTTRLEVLVINVINFAILIFALVKSGNWERQVIREELAGEADPVITPEEYEGVQAEKRFRLRRVPGYPRRLAAKIRTAQNSLAFHKQYLQRKGRATDTDPLAQYWRGEIARLRSSASTKPV